MPRLSEQEKGRLAELVADGVPFWRICEVIGRDRWTTRRNINYLKRPPKAEPKRSPLRLSLGEREEISRGLAAGESLRSIARRLGRAPSTIGCSRSTSFTRDETMYIRDLLGPASGTSSTVVAPTHPNTPCSSRSRSASNLESSVPGATLSSTCVSSTHRSVAPAAQRFRPGRRAVNAQRERRPVAPGLSTSRR